MSQEHVALFEGVLLLMSQLLVIFIQKIIRTQIASAQQEVQAVCLHVGRLDKTIYVSC